MQVTNPNNNLPIFSVNNAESTAFTLNQSHTLFHMLSDSLYMNPKLAMVREVLCNAWDAHITNGISHIPVTVTIQDGLLMIRDQGAGIAPNEIANIYLAYGKSTKQDDALVTGGFGLGSKAPFAYAPHFTVQSEYAGECTTYSLIKSDATKEGKPSATVISVSPTSCTGVTVIVPLEEGHVGIIQEYVAELAYFGGMLVNIVNAPPVPQIIGLSQQGGSFAVSDNFPYLRLKCKIQVRYGAVVYPVISNIETAAAYARTLGILAGATLVIQAAPNSLHISPSRENLIESPVTNLAIAQLLTHFCDQFDAVNNAEHIPMYIQTMRGVAKLAPFQIYGSTRNSELTYEGKGFHQLPKIITGHLDLVKKSLYACATGELLKKRHEARLAVMSEMPFNHQIPKELLKKLLIVGEYTCDTGASLLQSYVVDKMQQLISQHSCLCKENLYAMATNLKCRPEYLDTKGTVWGWQRNQIILVSAKSSAGSKLRNYAANLKLPDKLFAGNALVYMMPKSEKSRKEIRELFQTFSGMDVIDLSHRASTKGSTALLKPKVKAITPITPNPVGYICVASAIAPEEREAYFNYCKPSCTHVSYIESPDWYIDFSAGKSREGSFHPMTQKGRSAIVRLFGNVGAVARTTKELLALQTSGVPSLTQYLANACLQFLRQHKQAIKADWQNGHFVSFSSDHTASRECYWFVQSCIAVPDIASQLKVSRLTDVSTMSDLLIILNHMEAAPKIYKASAAIQMRNKLFKTTIPPKFLKLCNTAMSNRDLLRLLSIHDVVHYANKTSSCDSLKNSALQLIRLILTKTQ